MKTVFKSDEIAHIWAHKSAPHGRCPSNISFDGDVILSYATAIARHITHKGKAAMIVNDTSYSNSTAKHCGKLRRAIPSSIPVFYIGEMPRGTRLDVLGGEIFDYAIRQAARAEQKASKARRMAGFWQGEAAKWMERAQEVNAFYGLRRKVDAQVIERLRTASVEAERVAKKAAEVKAAKERAEYETAYEDWKNSVTHDNGHTAYFPPSLFPVAFRVEGEELVSTLGARVPLHAARVAYRFAMSKRGQEWRENGETCPVGHYRLNAINEHGIVAGCHRIAWSELERLASVLA